MQNLWSKFHIRTEPSVTCYSQHYFGLLCVQDIPIHIASSGVSVSLGPFQICLRTVKSTCTVPVCCCQTNFFFKVVGPLSLNTDQLHKFYYISFPFHLPCRKGVHTELSISTSPGSVLWLYNLKGEI